MRGYIYGECKEVKSETECRCREPLSRKALMEYITAKLSKHYPDVHLLADIIEDFVEARNRSYSNKKWDGKWRPLPLLIGVLYKLQERQDKKGQNENIGKLLQPAENDVVPLLGYYWHVLMAADSNIRPGTNEVEQSMVMKVIEKNKLKYASALNINIQDVPWVWTSEIERNRTSMLNYIPDHIITVDHKRKCIVLTILGTRVFPAPQPLDIIMDLVATTEPFLGGEAHAGMVWGTRNLVTVAVPKLVDELKKHPGYSILIIGYSLGAGLAQLLTLELELGKANEYLPSGTEIKTIGYGSPPVFTSNSSIPILRNIFLVQNNNDGISGASLRNVNDVFQKTSAIDKLNYSRRQLLKMLLSDVDPDEAEKQIATGNITVDSIIKNQSEDGVEWIDFNEFANEEQKSNFDDVVKEDNDAKDRFYVEDHIWEEVNNVVSSIPKSKEPNLHHIGHSFLVIRRKDDQQLKTQIYHGLNQTDIFSQQLLFSVSMFDDHMPGGYNYIFENVGHLNNTVLNNLGVLDSIVGIKEKTGFRKKLKKKWRIFKTNTKEFFKGLG